MRRAAEQAFLPLVFLLLWQAGAQTGALPRYLSSPGAIGLELWSLFVRGELAPALGVSLWRALAGFAVGCASGVVLGLMAGLTKAMRGFLDPFVAFFYPIPKIAFLPVVLLLFGLGDGSKIAIISLSVFFPVFIAARHAVAEVDQLLIWSARSMGAGRLYIFWRVILPATRPQLFAGARVGLSLSFVLLFAAELIGSKNGLGDLVHQGEEALRFDLMLAAIVSFAALGFVSDLALMALRKRMLWGQMIGTQEQGS